MVDAAEAALGFMMLYELVKQLPEETTKQVLDKHAGKFKVKKFDRAPPQS
jgi:hypothetical protein